MILPQVLLRVVLLCALGGVGAAQARNELFMQPIPEAMRKSHLREIVGDFPLRFGAATAVGVEMIQHDAQVDGVGSVVAEDSRKHELIRPTDAQVCDRAFADAVRQLVELARQAGAVAIVGIVSVYKGNLRDDPLDYECHAGISKSYVSLRAQFARSLPPSRGLPPASDFAALDDVAAVPISDEGKARYRYFLSLPSPRAFVVYADGHWRFYSKDPEAMTKALDECARLGRPCWLYAADDRVVWTADASRRIGTSAQLPGGATPAAVVDDHP